MATQNLWGGTDREGRTKSHFPPPNTQSDHEKKSLSLLTFAGEFSVAAPVNGLVAPQQEKREAEEKPSKIPRV